MEQSESGPLTPEDNRRDYLATTYYTQPSLYAIANTLKLTGGFCGQVTIVTM